MTSNQYLATSHGDVGGSERSIPSWLSLPPSGTVAAPVSTRPQVLPVHQLAWENLERLCLRLLRRTQEIEQVLVPGAPPGVTRLYGSRGQAQQGIDVYSRDPLPLDAAPPERPAVCLQARRVQKVTKTGIKNAVSDFLKGTWAPTSRKFIYATSAFDAPTFTSKRTRPREPGSDCIAPTFEGDFGRRWRLEVRSGGMDRGVADSVGLG